MVIDATESSFDSEVKQSQVPVIVDFYGERCGPCKRLAPLLDKMSEEFSGQVKIVKVDAESNYELAVQHQVQGLPTLILYKQGEVVGRKTGFLPEPALRELTTNLIG